EAATDGADLPPGDGRNLLDQVGIPAGGEPDRLRERRRAGAHEARERLFVCDRRDAEARTLSEEALDPIVRLGGAHGIDAGAGDPRDLADAERQGLLHAIVVELAVDEQLRKPHTAELRALLLECHAPEQLVDVHEKSTCSASRRIASASSPGSQPSPISSSRRWWNRSR